MAAETKSGFMIDDRLYEMPSLDTFTMDEAQVLYDYSGLTIEDFAPGEDVEVDEQGDYEFDDAQKQKLKNPGFMRALVHVAYQRGHPKMNPAKVKALIGNVNMISALEHLGSDEDDAGPPALTTEQELPSPSGSVGSSESSGNGSERSSEPPAVRLAATTTIGSDTSSILDRTGSAA